LSDWKTRLSILWLIHIIGGVYNVVLELFLDGNFDQIEGFPVNDYSLLLISIVWLGPLVMAYLSQVLEYKINRKVNMIVGSVYAIFLAVDFFISLISDPSLIVINPLLGVIWSILIVWTARTHGQM
jgi:hypothetical protein